MSNTTTIETPADPIAGVRTHLITSLRNDEDDDEEDYKLLLQEAEAISDNDEQIHDQSHLCQSPLAPITTTVAAGQPRSLRHAPSTPACGWEPATSDQELYVPLAETWHYHRAIKNRNGNTIFSLLQEEQIGRLIQSSPGEPILRMIIGDANRQVVAVIVREAKHGMDGYAIYGPRAAAESLFGEEAVTRMMAAQDQPHSQQNNDFFLHSLESLGHHLHRGHPHDEHSTPYRFRYYPRNDPEEPRQQGTTDNHELDESTAAAIGDTARTSGIALELYPIACVVQGVLGKTYTVTSPDKQQTIRWRADNGQFRKTLLCCPWCIVMGICMWEFEFQDLNILQRKKQHSKSYRWWRGRGRRQIASGGSSSSSSTLRDLDLDPVVAEGEEETVALVRDQEIRTVDVGVGTSPLLALCVTYAIDRLTRPLL